MNYDKIVESLKKAGKRDYAPEFSIKSGKRCWHIYDGETAIVDFYVPDENTPGERYALDIFKFSPFEDAIIANHPYNRPDIHYSETLCEDTDWTRLEAVMDSGDSPYMLPILQLYGVGVVWFDCLKFEKESLKNG